MASYTAGPAEKRYAELKADRQPYVTRNDECAALTIPRYMSAGDGGGRVPAGKLRKTWQGTGSLCVNNLSAKLLITTMPPEAAMFRFKANDEALRQAQQEKAKADLDQALAAQERNAVDKIEACADRAVVFDGFKRCTIGGNALINLYDDGSRVIPLERFVVVRDGSDNLLEIVVEDPLAPETLPKDLLKYVSERGIIGRHKDSYGKKSLRVYTHIQRRNEQMHLYQELCGRRVDGSEGAYPVDRCPWIPMRFFAADSEAYGRSYAEEHYGALQALENLYKAITEGTAAAARVLTMVNPNGITRVRDVDQAPNGAVVVGNAADVTTFQLDKARDFSTGMTLIERIERGLERAFLVNTGIQRPGERVTAEEIQFMAKQLDDALGGVYTIFSKEFQRPFVNARLHLMEMNREMPQMPRDIVRPTILTGYDALGRQSDKRKLLDFSKAAVETVGEEDYKLYVNPSEQLKRLATADQIDPNNLIRSEEEVAAEQQRQQQMAMASQLGPEALKLVGNAVTKGAPPQ
ncbi:phage tail protein [Hyphomicrobium sp. xq]|uniref:Phage tail protein n=1 Tax=Hyphomicrobium album TaxID=2665159 RepID=A0A6I3KEB7_9HYPH|nr:portal protein [Hyphomicrobium album]MTD92888.1 phage tail protein [Hyphomicrobium album]